MQQGYFSRSWAAIRQTPHWIRKMMVLALVSLIPIFGAIVVGGYLWGWARDAAWGVENPMPEHVFSNEDGHLYGRGFFAMVISFVLSLIPGIFSMLAFGIFGAGSFVATDAAMQFPGIWGFGVFGAMAITIAVFVLSAAVVPISWVAIMRMSIYTTFSSGFAPARIWAMIRRDPVGLIKIFAMDIILTAAVSLVLGAVFFGLFLLGMMGMGVLTLLSMDASAAATAITLMGAGLVVLAAMVAGAFASALGVVWVQAMVARAMGYWTAQFDVASWRGQSEPMPCGAVG